MKYTISKLTVSVSTLALVIHVKAQSLGDLPGDLIGGLPGDLFCSEAGALLQLGIENLDSLPSVDLDSLRPRAEVLASLPVALDSEELLPDDSVVDAVEETLTLIATEHPYLKPLLENPFAGLPWIPGEVLVFFDEATQNELEAGTYDSQALDALNTELGAVGIEWSEFGKSFALFKFETLYNPESLAVRFLEVPGVQSAESNRLLGGGNSIHISEDGTRFTFGLGWGDCASGCTVKYSWSFCVNLDDDTITDFFQGCEASLSMQENRCPESSTSILTYEESVSGPSPTEEDSAASKTSTSFLVVGSLLLLVGTFVL